MFYGILSEISKIRGLHLALKAPLPDHTYICHVPTRYELFRTAFVTVLSNLLGSI
jgi:hypothetical protein